MYTNTIVCYRLSVLYYDTTLLLLSALITVYSEFNINKIVHAYHSITITYTNIPITAQHNCSVLVLLILIGVIKNTVAHRTHVSNHFSTDVL